MPPSESNEAPADPTQRGRGWAPHVGVEDPVWRVAKGDVDELQHGRRQLAHILEVQPHHLLLGHRLCEPAAHLVRGPPAALPDQACSPCMRLMLSSCRQQRSIHDDNTSLGNALPHNR